MLIYFCPDESTTSFHFPVSHYSLTPYPHSLTKGSIVPRTHIFYTWVIILGSDDLPLVGMKSRNSVFPVESEQKGLTKSTSILLYAKDLYEKAKRSDLCKWVLTQLLLHGKTPESSPPHRSSTPTLLALGLDISLLAHFL